MPKQQKPNSRVSVTIAGDVSGQVVVGDNNKVIKSVAHPSITSKDVEELRYLLLVLKNKIQMDAPENKKVDALQRVNELEHALLEAKPDRTTIEYVKKWFGKHLPNLVETVTDMANEFEKHIL